MLREAGQLRGCCGRERERSLGFSALEPRPPPSFPPSIPEPGVLISKSLCFSSFPQAGVQAGEVRRRDPGWLWVAAVPQLGRGWGMSEAVHFLLQRELYNRKVLEIFRIPVQGEWHYQPHPPFPASVPFSRMNLDEEWEETQIRRSLSA